MDALSYEIPSINESRSDIPEGNYGFEFVGADGPYENKFDTTGRAAPRYLLKFKVVDSPDEPEWEGKEVGFFYSLTNSPKGNLYPIYKALNGGTIDPNQRWKLGDVLGRRFRGTVVMKTPEAGGDPRPKLEGATPWRERKTKASEQPNTPF